MKSHHSRRMAALALANAFFFCTASAARADTFGAASDIPIAPDTATIIAADLNGDGRADIVSGITGRLLTGILISRQDGTFANMPALSASGSLGAGDFDGDNKTDIVCLGRVGDGSTISIFPGNGDGTFGTPTVTPIPGVRWLVQLADFNSDGRPDLLTAPAVYGKLPVAVLLSRPGGLVSQPIEIPGTVDNPVVADFDGDGVSDVIVGVRISQHSFVPGLFAGLGDGTFAEPVSLPSFGVPGASGDFNGDGAIDVAGLKDGGEDGYDTAIVGFAYGDGHGMFHSVIDVTLPALTSVQRSVVDFDGDGRDDLLAIGKDGLAEIRAADVYLVHGADAGEARDVETYGALLPNTVVVGDFNGDRLSDLAVGGYEGLDDYDFTLSLRLNTRLAAYSAVAVMKPGKPFRITVEGANFSTESRIFIGDSDTPWPHAKLKSPTRLVLKGGDALDLQFPPGVEVQIRIESPDGQTAEVSLVR